MSFGNQIENPWGTRNTRWPLILKTTTPLYSSISFTKYWIGERVVLKIVACLLYDQSWDPPTFQEGWTRPNPSTRLWSLNDDFLKFAFSQACVYVPSPSLSCTEIFRSCSRVIVRACWSFSIRDLSYLSFSINERSSCDQSIASEFKRIGSKYLKCR